jgi:hypothetical protein
VVGEFMRDDSVDIGAEPGVNTNMAGDVKTRIDSLVHLRLLYPPAPATNVRPDANPPRR